MPLVENKAEMQVLPDGHVMLPDGSVVPVVGELVFTRDGYLVGNNARVWFWFVRKGATAYNFQITNAKNCWSDACKGFALKANVEAANDL